MIDARSSDVVASGIGRLPRAVGLAVVAPERKSESHDSSPWRRALRRERGGDLPEGVAARALEVDWDAEPHGLYLGSGHGVYSSHDGGVTWIKDGLDLPNVNTIFVNECDRYGLAELHQLRGRVGRSRHRAYCFLMLPEHRHMNPDARKRVQAIREFSKLGAGFQIAMRDLEIRGSGNILGAEQSGFINEIGFEMYTRILDEAVREIKYEEYGELFEEGVGGSQRIRGNASIGQQLDRVGPSQTARGDVAAIGDVTDQCGARGGGFGPR